MNKLLSTLAHRRWAVVALLWPVVLLNYLDRQMLSTIRTSIRADIPSIANDQDFGTLMAVFMWIYAFLSPLGGFCADRWNRRWTVILSLLVWSAVTFLTGFGRSYKELLFLRALMGISEAFYLPAALALIADYHPGPTRARAVGLHQSGLYAGLALGGIAGYIAQTSSWRNCFVGFGGIGITYSLVLMCLLRDAPSVRTKSERDEVRSNYFLNLGILFHKRDFWILVIYFTLPAIAGWMTKSWLPTFLGDQLHLKEGPAGLSATGYIHLASFAGVILGGTVADVWSRTSVKGRVFASALGTLLMAPALLGLGNAWSMASAIGFMILFGLGWGFFDCNNMPILCQIATAEQRATGYGIMNLVSISVGAGITVALGWMRDKGIHFSVAFSLAALVTVLSAGLILLIRPAVEPKTEA